jgi:hypothetical protein
MLREMQAVRGKTRPQTFMTGHTGYVTSSRKAQKKAVEPPETIVSDSSKAEGE